VIRRHVIEPLETTGVHESCFAAAMLIFSSVDGLGMLIHSDSNAHPGARFKCFLMRMGQKYAALDEQLWKLRCSLVHSAMNVACFMSKTDDARGEHLEVSHDHVFVQTALLLLDFKTAVEHLEAEFRTDSSLLERAESRLEWAEIQRSGWRDGGPPTTPPPGIHFVAER